MSQNALLKAYINSFFEKEMTQAQFEQYFFPLVPLLMRTARRMLGHHREDAEDIVQEVVIKIWEERERIFCMKNPEAYCQKMVVNACMKLLKSTHNYAGLGSELHMMAMTHSESKIVDGEHLLVELIRRLPPKAARILMLRIFEEREISDIAEIMHETEINVRQILSRSRRKIIGEAQNRLNLKRTSHDRKRS